MIPRYTRPEMAQIWTDENKYQIWMDVERYACEAMEKLGTIPKGVAKAIEERGAFEVDRIHEIEAEVKHDVIAFLTNLAEHVGEESRYVHQGMTSSDVLDTCLSVQMKQSGELIIKDLERLNEVLERRAVEHKLSLTIGRSHGIHGEPTTFGLKLLGHLASFKRNLERMIKAADQVGVCAISGAVGTHATIDPSVQEHVAKKMDLRVEEHSTQIIPRDRHAEFMTTLGIISSSIENLATEIRHLQRTEVREVEEFFSEKQKGSSAMPHKRNPILTENLTGQARIVRAAVIPALENVTTWHERDISHSSVERVLVPDACIAINFALNRLIMVMDKLLIYPERMMKNMESMGGLVFSQRVLLALTQAGVSREDGYRLVQRNAMKVWKAHESGEHKHFIDFLKEDEEVTAKVSDKEIEAIFDYSFYTKHVDDIFDRVLG